MKLSTTPLPGVTIIDPMVYEDGRGFFYESFHQKRFAEAGIEASFTQTNVSQSHRGVLRGLHYQWPNAQGKLVSVLDGEVYDVAVDVRPQSPTFRQWFACILSAKNRRHLWIPDGYAHGFCVISERATFLYQCTALYDRGAEAIVRWNDASLAIDWPVSSPLLSMKDAAAPTLDQIEPDQLPPWQP